MGTRGVPARVQAPSRVLLLLVLVLRDVSVAEDAVPTVVAAASELLAAALVPSELLLVGAHTRATPPLDMQLLMQP